MIDKNSPNSISPDPSASTVSTIYYTYDLFSTKPRAINGSSNSSTPISPDLSSSNELK